MDATHNPEFTTVEAYVAYSDLHGMMDLIEGLFRYVTDKVLGTHVVTYQGTELDFGKPFARITCAKQCRKRPASTSSR